MDSCDVLIIGGGIIGLACARELVQQGRKVVVVERSRSLNSSASAAAAGMLAPLAEVGEDDLFLAVCRQARDLWQDWAPALAEEGGHWLDYDRSGALLLAGEDPQRLDRLAQRAQELGEPHQFLSWQELRQQVPGIAPQASRALWLTGEHRVDNRRVLRALSHALAQHGGACERATAVEKVVITSSHVVVEGRGFKRRCQTLLVCAGAHSSQLAGLPPLPIRPVRGQMLELAGVDWPWQGTVRGPEFYAVRRGKRRLLIGATVEEAGFAPKTTPAGQAALLAFCQHFFPDLSHCAIRATWAGLRPATPDGLPILGPLRGTPVWIATGHYRNGILLAPWTARQIAAWIAGQEPQEPWQRAFSPERFNS